MILRPAIFLSLLIFPQTGICASSGTIISAFDYSQPQGSHPSGYDNIGNVIKIVETYGHASVNDRTVTNLYDKTYRLTTETIVETGGPALTTAYLYDKNNNRTSKVVTGGSNAGTWVSVYGTIANGFNSNQLESVTNGSIVTTFLYDSNGNRISKKVGATVVQTYDFDFENRLISLVDSTKGTFAYSYDHRTRRVGRDEQGSVGVPPASSEISFSGGLSVQEYTTGNSQPTMEYIRGSDYGGGIGGVLYTIRSGARSYNAYNSRGDVVSKTDDANTITWQAAYEAFGTRTQEQGATLDRQKANTKDEDPNGLLNEGFRYRDLEAGVFITRDPLGFVDGPNVYTYVRQNPWTFFDPYGLWIEDAALGIPSMGFGLASAVDNFKRGEIGWGIADLTGVAIDGVAVAIPGVPGGVGMATTATKTLNSANDARIAVDKANEARIAAEKANEARIAAEKANEARKAADKAAETGELSAKTTKELAEKAVDEAADIATSGKKPLNDKERRSQQQAEARKKKHGDENWEEPASEDYAKWKARELEKAKGKDARRKAHDKKKRGEGDRSKRRLDEDYDTE